MEHLSIPRTVCVRPIHKMTSHHIVLVELLTLAGEYHCTCGQDRYSIQLGNDILCICMYYPILLETRPVLINAGVLVRANKTNRSLIPHALQRGRV